MLNWNEIVIYTGLMEKTKFYEKCAGILGTQYNCQPFTQYKRTRWNNRSAGSGRYPGYGIIRVFGDMVQINIRHPFILNTVASSMKDALVILTEQMERANGGSLSRTDNSC
jgi:hypothetical protein